jgi:hypothetical protein
MFSKCYQFLALEVVHSEQPWHKLAQGTNSNLTLTQTSSAIAKPGVP